MIAAPPESVPIANEAQGLSQSEASQRLAASGPNELPQSKRRSLFRLALSVLAEPMFLLLALAAGIYLLLGEHAEGLMLAVFAALTIGLVVFQQVRSERAIEALRALGAPSARVMRDGIAVRIATRELVPGDLVLIGEGERVPADALLRRCEQLAIDESLLTGESLPVRKVPALTASPAESAPGGDDLPWVFSGTLVVRGHGIAQVVNTGIATHAGRIGVTLATIEIEPTLLQRTVGRLVRWFGLIALLVSGGLVLLYGVMRGDWIEGLLAGIALAMAMLPEEFPMALAIFLALGAWRLAQVKVLVRRPAVIETLGAASVLCVDKTGTLTENRMRIRALLADGELLELRGDETVLPEQFHRLLEFGVLASKREAIDPMDLATNVLGKIALAGSEHLHGEWPLTREYGLTPDLPALSRIWKREDGSAIVAAKGAPEAIATLCHMDAGVRASVLADVERLAQRGLRVLAVAFAELGDAQLPESAGALSLGFLGLLAFEDPLRATVPAAVAQARAAGIAVAMITGDYPATALAIAAEAGIDVAAGVISGAQIAAMDDTALAAAVAKIRVFARVQPDQKLRLVEAFKAGGDVVAMTGDGVNDAPALKAAHIGLAMGTRATDVARETAGIVLLDDDFGRLVEGVRLGRRIFDNLRKVLIYITAIHVPIAGLALFPILLGLPPLLFPAHVVLIEMVIDPVCSIAFENAPAEPDLMQRRPRDPAEALVGWRQLLLALVQGILLLAATLSLYLIALANGTPDTEARALSVVALTAGNLMLVRVNSTRTAALPHLFDAGYRPYWIITAAASSIIGACLFIPSLAELFRFTTPSVAGLAIAIVAGAGSVLLFDLIKGLGPVRRALGANSNSIVAQT